MPFKKTLLAIMMFGAAAAQADYRAEIAASLGGSNVTQEYDLSGPDYEVEEETGYFDVEATFYLDPVKTANVPLGEAAFLSKASFASFYLSREDVEHEEDESSEDYDFDRDMMLLGGRFVVPNVGLIIEAGFGQGEEDGDDVDNDIDVLMFGFGGYIGDNITLVLNYFSEETDYGDSESDEHKVWTITYSQYIPFSGEMALKIEPFIASHKFEDDFDDADAVALGVDATLYINRQLSVYLEVEGYGVDESDYEESTGTSKVGVDYFFNDNFKIGAALSSVSGEGEEFDTDFETEGGGIEFNAAVRF
jgi:hypothetical protein